MEGCTRLIRSRFPDINEDILQYVEGVLKTTSEDLESVEDIYDGIGEVLLDVDQGMTEADVRKICVQLASIFKQDWKEEKSSELQNHLQTIHQATSSLNTVQSTPATSLDLIPEELPNKKISNQIDDGSKRNEGIKTKQAKKAKGKIKNPSASGSKNGSSEVTVTQRWNEKQIKASIRTNEYISVKDIHLEDFDISYGKKELIKDADFVLEYGRRYGFVGRNGLGKTAMLRCMSEGKVRIPEHISCLHVQQEVDADSRSALQAVLQSDTAREELLLQERSLTMRQEAGEEGVITALAAVFEELEVMESDSAPARASVILSSFGFTPEMQGRETCTFSGGWRMRIALAQALFCRPDLLLLDEPTNMLDMQTIIWLEAYLNSWPSTLLVVSHDRSFLDQVVTDILHLHEKRIHTFRGNYTQYHDAACDLDNMKYRDNVQNFINKNKYLSEKKIQARVAKSVKMLANLPVLEKESVMFHFPDVDKLKGPILSLNGVSFTYPGSSEPVLKQVDLSISMDTKVCFVGQNGSGKTTLINLLLDQLVASEGQRSAHKHLRIGHFTQHFVDQLDMAVCGVELLQREVPGLRVEEYRKMLGQFGMGGSAALQKIDSLSGGQKARVALAILASKQPNCLIMDEPTNHLDMDTVEALAVALPEFHGGVVLVSHDERLLGNVCEELWVCQERKVKLERGGIEGGRRRG